MKKLLKTAFVLCFFLIAFNAGAVAPKAHAEIASGAIGNTILFWSLEDNGELKIWTRNEEQKACIPDYPIHSTADYRQYKDQIKRVVWARGVSVTSIGARAFADCGSLLIAVIPASVNDIAENAFAGTDIAVICPADSYAAAWCDDHHIPHNP